MGQDKIPALIVDDAISVVNRRCEKRHGCAWSAHLQRLWTNSRLSAANAATILQSKPEEGILYLSTEGFSEIEIADVYCTTSEEVSSVL